MDSHPTEDGTTDDGTAAPTPAEGGPRATHRPRRPTAQDDEPAGVDEEISEQLSVDPDRDGQKG